MDLRTKLVKEGYDKCGRQYLLARNKYKNQKYLDDLINRLSKGDKVLDLGCGGGIPIDRYLVGKDMVVTGVDISGEQIKLARTNVPTANFLQVDMREIDYPENSFQAVVSFYAIFHVPRIEHYSLFKKIYNILEKGGYFLLTLGSSDWEGEEDFYGVKMFWSHYDPEKNLLLLKQSGFEIIYHIFDESEGEKHLVVFCQKK